MCVCEFYVVLRFEFFVVVVVWECVSFFPKYAYVFASNNTNGRKNGQGHTENATPTNIVGEMYSDVRLIIICLHCNICMKVNIQMVCRLLIVNQNAINSRNSIYVWLFMFKIRSICLNIFLAKSDFNWFGSKSFAICFHCLFVFGALVVISKLKDRWICYREVTDVQNHSSDLIYFQRLC